MYIDSLTYEQFMMLGDAELSRRFSMQDEAEQKAKIDREQANELEYVDESQKSDAAESVNSSNGSAGAKPVRNPERENHHYYLWIFHHLHSVFQVLKDPDYCAARCDCLFHDGRKQNGQSYNGYLLQIFPVVCV